MVGVPRSGGCQLCRSRRIKCDEARPACGNCRRYGTDCPGYARGLKFVAGKHQIRPKERRALANTSRNVQSVEICFKTSPSETIASPIQDLQQYRASPLVVLPTPNRGEFINTILEFIRPSTVTDDMTGLFSWLDRGKLGRKALLDGAVCSLALHLCGKQSSDWSMVSDSRWLYGQSLSALQAALSHPTEWKSSETLCAAMLLCIFELFAGTAEISWLQHAKGIGVLMAQRGPQAHAEGWDAAMLLSFRSILVMVNMFFSDGESCFLTSPEWRDVARDNGRGLVKPASIIPELTMDMIDDFYFHLAKVPEILSKGFHLREMNSQGKHASQAHIDALARKAAKTRHQFLAWFEDVKAFPVMPKEVLSQDPEPLYATVFEFKNAWVGCLMMGYWATLLILEETLMQCKCKEDFRESEEENCQNILKSLEQVGEGTLGPFRIGYSIRIAYDFANAESQLWIRNKLDLYTKSYAAINKETFPEPKADRKGLS